MTSKRTVPYDELWVKALAYPLVSEADLKEWINGWQNDGTIEILGLGPRERVAKREKNHRIRLVT